MFSLHANILITAGREDIGMEIYVFLYVIYSVGLSKQKAFLHLGRRMVAVTLHQLPPSTGMGREP